MPKTDINKHVTPSTQLNRFSTNAGVRSNEAEIKAEEVESFSFRVHQNSMMHTFWLMISIQVALCSCHYMYGSGA